MLHDSVDLVKRWRQNYCVIFFRQLIFFDRIKGDVIPFAARIVALADVYDALISRRIYKSALPHDLAKSIICAERGKHFDPIVVDAFLDSEEQFIDIQNRFKNTDK